MGLELPEAIATVNPVANIHKAYGPYVDLAAAKTAVPSSLRAKGLTVGVVESGKVREFWFKEGILDSHLVPKEIDYEFASIIAVNDVSVDWFTESYLTFTHGAALDAGQWAECSQQMAMKTLTGWNILPKNHKKVEATVDYDALYSSNLLDLSTVNTVDIIHLSTTQETSLTIKNIGGLMDGREYYIKSNGSWTGIIEHSATLGSNGIKTIDGLDIALAGALQIDNYVKIYRRGVYNIVQDVKTYS